VWSRFPLLICGFTSVVSCRVRSMAVVPAVFGPHSRPHGPAWV
jgi:hypothetical protein